MLRGRRLDTGGAARMVAALKAEGLIRTPAVEAAFHAADRQTFLPGVSPAEAYEDQPQPIGLDQTISAPHMVAIMVEALEAGPGMRVLEVGGGSGWHAAVLGALVRPHGRVVSIERLVPLAAAARENLRRAGFLDTVEVVVGDGTLGHAAGAPYDRISVAAASPHVPQALVDQLSTDGGRLLIPVGPLARQELVSIERRGGSLHRRHLGGCVFVPLIGADGYAPAPGV
jgi:protein-L-isoaspartate(D-aspartate) O-methyltransferase